MDLSTVLIVISAVLGIVAVVAGTQWRKILLKFREAKDLLAAAASLIEAFVKALEDNTITPEEVEQLKLKWAELKAAFKKLLGKDLEEIV